MRDALPQPEPAPDLRTLPAADEPESVVYYITRVDKPGLVKIGTTTNLRKRMLALAARDRPVSLLGTEPGGRAVEHLRHKEFAALRLDGEWFTFTDELRAHVRQACGLWPVVTYGKVYGKSA